MSTTKIINPFLEKNFAPVRKEINADNLEIIGQIPPELSGMFIRNGPNPQFEPIGQYHWFDGDGMLHGVKISNGKASYCNRYVRTRGFAIERDAGGAIWTGFLEPPRMDNPYGPVKNTANTSLVWHAGQLLALWEGGEPHAIKLPQLKTIGSYDYNGQLTSAFTAHPKVDAVTGEMMFFGYSLAEPPYLKYSVVSADGKLSSTVPIDIPVGVMMHDFAITEKYTIFMDLPMTFRPERMQQGKPGLLFESDRASRFGILPRHGDNSSVRWFETPACYVYHTLNAYEEGNEVVLIACRMNSTNVLVTNESDRDPDGDIPRLHRWRFNLSNGKVQEEMLDDMPSEFPVINDQKTGRKTRYGYTGKMSPNPIPLFDGLIKYDLVEGKSQIGQFDPGCYGGDPVFVPHPNAKTEDEGWLLTFVHNEHSGVSELLIIDAQDLTAEPLAKIILPQRVPYGFHSIWISNAKK